MRALILSDIHGSSLAARQALTFFEKFNCDKIFLLGDTLYHGPRNPLPAGHGPMGVVEALAPYKDHIVAVRGNCDAEIDLMMLDFPIENDTRSSKIADSICSLATDTSIYRNVSRETRSKASNRLAPPSPQNSTLPQNKSHKSMFIYTATRTSGSSKRTSVTCSS